MVESEGSLISDLSSFVYFIIPSSDKIYLVLCCSREILINWHVVSFLTAITSCSGVALLPLKIRTGRKNADFTN